MRTQLFLKFTMGITQSINSSISHSFLTLSTKYLQNCNNPYKDGKKYVHMTICIACVCKYAGDETVVMATDHMIDVGIGQFEHDITKYKKLNEKNMVMLSGSALLFNELTFELGTGDFDSIKNKIHENFVKVRKDIIQKQLLDKFGLNDSDIQNSIKLPIQNPIMNKLIESIAKLELKTSILLVGFNKGEVKISEIQESGFLDYTDIHFHAIGSGQIQAINTLLFQSQSKKNHLSTTIYNVYKAKRNAEVSSGVGVETDILIFSEKGCVELTKEDIEILKGIYNKELDLGRNSEDLNKLSILS